MLPTHDGKAVEDAIHVSPAHRIVIVEGAYLWHSLGQWVELRRMLSSLLYVDAGEAVVGAQV